MNTAITAILIFIVTVALDAVPAPPTRSQCMVFGPLTLPNGKKTSGYRNLGGCVCKEAHDQELSQPAMDKYIPACEKDGTWTKRQTQFLTAWCVDRQGNQISEENHEQPSKLQCK
ncbi:U24-ctenitoxin-Pn1a-like [Paramacrobiotus metropolitanus]|uniref:U24-ctenitoxin-Pn1a-like n=1 Tax=Paramacrobiotus metropolitanus TaxID=2943436 RepID=UPI00244561E5|nr:U24-ctenitoxin-Pn1a-like [Paramacrobiotus metropolitanus]